MGRSREPGEKFLDRLKHFTFDKKVLKVAFYCYLSILALFLILAMFSYEYSGDWFPTNLFHCNRINYTFAGTPDYTYVYSTNLSIGIGGINNSRSDLEVRGESNMTLYPTGPLTLALNNGETEHGPGPVKVTMLPGEAANVSILVTREDDFYRSMYFGYRNQTVPRAIDEGDQGNLFKVIRKNYDQYLINASFSSGAGKTFKVYKDSRWDFRIKVTGNNGNLRISDRPENDVKSIEYDGQIEVTTTGDLLMSVPASSMSPADGYMVKLVHSDGTLDVRHKEYKCTFADNVKIVPSNELEKVEPAMVNRFAHVMLINGHIITYGQADELRFRELDFGSPITVLVKEGKLALLTGLLSSFFTIMLARVIAQFKKK